MIRNQRRLPFNGLKRLRGSSLISTKVSCRYTLAPRILQVYHATARRMDARRHGACHARSNDGGPALSEICGPRGRLGAYFTLFQARHIGLLTSLLPRSRARTFCALWEVYSPISCHQCISTCSEPRCQRAAVRIILVRLRNVSWLAGTSSVQRDEDISNFRAQRLVSFGYPLLAII